MPDITLKHRVISVVIYRNGYQARIEETIDINFHPYTQTITRIAEGPTLVQAITAALTGRQLKPRINA